MKFRDNMQFTEIEEVFATLARKRPDNYAWQVNPSACQKAVNVVNLITGATEYFPTMHDAARSLGYASSSNFDEYATKIFRGHRIIPLDTIVK